MLEIRRGGHMRRAWFFGLFALVGCGSSNSTPPSPVLKSGEIGTWMGDGTQGFDGDGHAPAQTWLNQPTDIEFGPDGMAYLVDWNNHRIRRLEADGTVKT